MLAIELMKQRFLLVGFCALFALSAHGATTVSGSKGGLGGLITSPVENGAFTFDNLAGQCKQSFMDTDPVTGATYFIVEPQAAAAQCKLTVNSEGIVIASVTTTGVPAVVYIKDSGSYSVRIVDLLEGSESESTRVSFRGGILPGLDFGGGPVATGNCALVLQRRSILGANKTYTSGWNIVSSVNAANCPHKVGNATIETNSVQVAVQEPFDLSIVKSVTVPNGLTSGTTVDYKFLIANDGDVPWTLNVTDALPKISAINCVINPLPAKTSTTCTATYVISAADVSAGSVSNSAKVTGVDNARPNSTGSSFTTSTSDVTFNVAAVTAIPGGTTPIPTIGPAALVGLGGFIAAFGGFAARRQHRSAQSRRL